MFILFVCVCVYVFETFFKCLRCVVRLFALLSYVSEHVCRVVFNSSPYVVRYEPQDASAAIAVLKVHSLFYADWQLFDMVM